MRKPKKNYAYIDYLPAELLYCVPSQIIIDSRFKHQLYHINNLYWKYLLVGVVRYQMNFSLEW